MNKKAIFGIGWLGLLQGTTRGIDFIRIAITARLLTQTAFGTFAIVTTTVNLLETLTETGFSYAVIHKQANIKEYAKTLLVINILRGLFLMVLNIILAKIVSLFFNIPQIFPLLLITSIIPLLKGLENPYVIVFYKDLTLHKEFVFRFIPALFTAVISIILAFLLHSTFALILGLVIGTAIEAVLSYFVIKADFSKPYKHQYFKELFNYGKWMSAGGVFSYLTTQIDNLFIGKVFGPAILGLYDLSFKLANAAFTEFTDIISQVSFPFFASIQKDKYKLKKSFKLNIITSFLISFCVSALLILFPKFFIFIAFGSKWENGATLLQILAIYGFFRATTNPIGPLMLAIGKPAILSKASFIQFILLILLLFPFAYLWQINGVAFAIVLSYVTTLPYYLYKTYRVFSV